MARLPQPGGDSGNWGDILNDYLSQALKSDGTIKDNAVTSNNIAPNAITGAKIAADTINAIQIADGSIAESLLSPGVQTKLNAASAGQGLTESDIVALLADPSSSLRQSLDVLYAGGSNPGGGTTPTEVTITTTGATFSPRISLASGSAATVNWSWSGGSATGISPTINFGSTATRTVTMSVDDGGSDAMADVETFNIGFNQTQDSGVYNLGSGYDHPVQAVTGIVGVNAMTGLKNFLASIPTLGGAIDFSGMSELEYIECYQSQVSGVTLTGCSSLIRLDLEGTQLTTLDLNPVASTLRDLRAAHQRSGAGLTLTPLASNLAVLYHFCVRDQPVTNHPTLAQMPLLEQLWNWNTGQTGALAIGGHTYIKELRSYDNDYTSVTGISGATGFEWIDFSGNNLDQSDVDGIISAINGLNTNGARRLDIRNTTPPSAAVASSISALQGRGWNVYVDAAVTTWSWSTSFDTDRANLAALATDGWVGVNNPVVNATSGDLNKTSSGSYQLLVNNGSGDAPANYEITTVMPHSALNSFNFIIGRYASGDGVRVGIPTAGVSSTNWVFGTAYDFNTNDTAGTTDNGVPTSWGVNQDHTITVRMQGSVITLILDGQTCAHATVAQNAALTATSWGLGGGSAETYRSFAAAEL